MGNIYIALVHYPVLNKNAQTIHTSVSNLDLHDIARAAYSFGIKQYFLVSPDESQHELIKTICGFWSQTPGLQYNPMRSEALEIVSLCPAIDDAISMITTQEKVRPVIVTTTAKKMPSQISYRYLRTLSTTDRPVLILFGTGYGLIDDVHSRADYVLAPIKGCGTYNHLSVRSAVAIILDRIFSEDIYGRNNGYSANSWQRPNQNRLSGVSRRRYSEGPL